MSKHTPEERTRTFKRCPVEGCDWKLITSVFVGGPDRYREISAHDQQVTAGEHMRIHFTPERQIFT